MKTKTSSKMKSKKEKEAENKKILEMSNLIMQRNIDVYRKLAK